MSKGFCVWFTGLSGSGKSTLTQALVPRLEKRGRVVSVLDGDEIRTHLSKGLGFSKEDRDTNIRRVAYVASLVAKHGGVVVTACISPYAAIRDEARQQIGNFVEVHADASLQECEKRDPKGLYKKARAGEIKQFTGVDDPYEAPKNPELRVQTDRGTVEDGVGEILRKLEALGYLAKE